MTGLAPQSRPRPQIVPLGDSALLVRFSAHLDDVSNVLALSLATRLQNDPIAGIVEIVPSLVSVLLRYDDEIVTFRQLSGEVALKLGAEPQEQLGRTHKLRVRFGGEDGPDLETVAQNLALSPDDFIAQHNANPLRVLTTGFAPGFVYCGFHPPELTVSRRPVVRPKLPIGTVLFAAGQTAITATEVPSGWHVIGRTDFVNFNPEQTPPTLLSAGDHIMFSTT